MGDHAPSQSQSIPSWLPPNHQPESKLPGALEQPTAAPFQTRPFVLPTPPPAMPPGPPDEIQTKPEQPRRSYIDLTQANFSITPPDPPQIGSGSERSSAAPPSVQAKCDAREAEEESAEDKMTIQTKEIAPSPGFSYLLGPPNPSLQRQSSPPQPKPPVPGDLTMADLMRLAPTAPEIAAPAVQRQAESAAGEASDEVEAKIQRTKGGGQPIAEPIRAPIEQAFGADFSDVRIHTGGESNALNQAVQAKAFTTGQDIYFRSGAYEPGSRSGQELLAHELTHIVHLQGATSGNTHSQPTPEQTDIPAIQRERAFSDRPPTAIEASAHALAGHDAMGEFLASSSSSMLETQTELQSASPSSSEEAQQYREQIEQLLKLNGIGVMSSHKVSVENRREEMFSERSDQSRVQPLRDAAANIHRLEETKEQLEDYLSDLRVVESDALFRRGDLADLLEELALSSNRIMSSDVRQGMIERFRLAQSSSSRDTMWLFVYGSAGYMQRLREQQIEAVTASLSLFFQNFPVFSQLDAEDVAEGGFESDTSLETQANRSFIEVLIKIDDTIRDIHSGDISPLDMPEIVRITRQELPSPLQAVLDDMRQSHENTRFWLNMGLTAAEILLAFVPVIGPALALGVGAANLAMQGEEMMDQMQMADVGANPYGTGPLGVTGPSAFEQTMFGVTAILTAVGAGAVVNSLRGGRATVSAIDDVAEVAARGSDELLTGGASAVDDLAEGAARGADEVVEGGAGAAGGSGSRTPPPDITDDAVRLAETGGDETITLYHGTDQQGLQGLGGLDEGRISVTRSPGEHQDFSRGFYLSEDVSVAESAARVRGGQRGGGMQHVLRYDIQVSDLGVVIDIRSSGAHRQLWEAFLDRSLIPEMPQMGTMREYLSGLGVEQRGIYFEEFLESINMQNADTIMGPIGNPITSGAVTSVRGESTQVVIRSQEVADRLNAIMRGETP